MEKLESFSYSQWSNMSKGEKKLSMISDQDDPPQILKEQLNGDPVKEAIEK